MVEQAPKPPSLKELVMSKIEEDRHVQLGHDFNNLAGELISRYTADIKRGVRNPNISRGSTEIWSTDIVPIVTNGVSIEVSVEDEKLENPRYRRKVGKRSLVLRKGDRRETITVSYSYERIDERALPTNEDLECGIAILEEMQVPLERVRPSVLGYEDHL